MIGFIKKIYQWFCGWFYGHMGNWKYNDIWTQKQTEDDKYIYSINIYTCPRCGYERKLVYKLAKDTKDK